MTALSTHIVLSTSHLTEEVDDMLTRMGEDSPDARDFGDWRNGLVRCGYAYGHWVRLPNPNPDDPDDRMAERIAAFPESLADCMRHANQYGVRWILFDRDEPASAGLTEHDWLGNIS